MYYVPEESILPASSRSTQLTLLIHILTASPSERTQEDHEFVFKFFCDNKFLCDIQRLKSLNAKQQCVANLTVDTVKPQTTSEQNQDKQAQKIVVDQIIVQQVNIGKDKKQEIIRTKYYVLLDTAKKQQIMKANQKYLRANIEILKKYMILKDLKYSQLLHMAYYMDQVTYKYKQEVYKQGDSPDYLYLAELGQFHYAKMLRNDIQKRSNKDKKNNKDRSKRYQQKSENPNRSKGSVSVQMQIGVIQGGCGQTFGEQQIVTQKTREYSMKCMSTQNLVMRIPSEKYKRVLSSTTITRMEWMKKESLSKIKLKNQMFSKMIQVKKNYQKYAQMIQKDNISKTQGLRFQQLDSAFTNSINRSMLPKIKSQSVASSDYYESQSQNHYKSVDKSRIIVEDEAQNRSSKIRRSYQSQQNQDHNAFALTNNNSKVQHKINRKITLDDQDGARNIHINNHINSSNQRILPTIQSDKSHVVREEDTKGMKVKNFSPSKPLVELRGLKHKFSGMIFANSLIKQKEQILNSKLVGKDASRDIFPIDLAVKKPQKPVVGILTKQQARQLRSAVHSKIFMQKLLVEALKKAGYNSEKNSEKYLDENPDTVIDIKNNLRAPKHKIKHAQKDSINLLTDNSFDQCYFKKIG